MMQGQNAVSPLSHTLALHFDSGDLTAIDHFNNIIQSRVRPLRVLAYRRRGGLDHGDAAVGGRHAA